MGELGLDGQKLAIRESKFAKLQAKLRRVVIPTPGLLQKRDATENGLATAGDDPTINDERLSQGSVKTVADEIAVGREPLVSAHLNQGASRNDEIGRNRLGEERELCGGVPCGAPIGPDRSRWRSIRAVRWIPGIRRSRVYSVGRRVGLRCVRRRIAWHVFGLLSDKRQSETKRQSKTEDGRNL